MMSDDCRKVFFKAFAQKVKEGKAKNKVFLSTNNGYIIGELSVDDGDIDDIEKAIRFNAATLYIGNEAIKVNDYMVFYDGIIGFSVYNEKTFPE